MLQCVIMRDSGTFTITERAALNDAQHNLTLAVYDAAEHRDNHHVSVKCHVVTSDTETVYRSLWYTFSDYGRTTEYGIGDIVRDVLARRYGDNRAVYVNDAIAHVSDDARGIVTITINGRIYDCLHDETFDGGVSSDGYVSPFAKHSFYDAWCDAEGVNIRDDDDGVAFSAAIMFTVSSDDTICDTSHQ